MDVTAVRKEEFLETLNDY